LKDHGETKLVVGGNLQKEILARSALYVFGRTYQAVSKREYHQVIFFESVQIFKSILLLLVQMQAQVVFVIPSQSDAPSEVLSVRFDALVIGLLSILV
jgi:hypothetical protein